MMKRWAAALAGALLLLSGCSSKDKAIEPVKKQKVAVSEKSTSQGEPVSTYPLTGMPAEILAEGRAVAVMVNNYPLARPQSGLNKADIVYEILAEGDITRFLAVFQSENPDNIGPVRSARDYYIELAKGLGALYVAHGYSPEAKQMLDSGYIDNLNGMVYDGTLFKRASFRKAPHNSYITFDNIIKGAAMKHYSLKQSPPAFQFMTDAESKNITGNKATSVRISYSSSHISDSSFEYDPKLGKYKRFFGDGSQTIDFETKEPVLVDNIFIIEASHRTIDAKGRRDIDLKSGGNAYLIQRGKVNKVQWENRDGQIVPVKNGKVVPFVPGHTWVNVVPKDPGLQESITFNVK